MVNVGQVRSQQRKARTEVGGQINARLRAHVDLSSNGRVDGNIVDLAGATERPACGEGLSIIRRHVEGRCIASVEIVVVLLVAGDQSSCR